jgi:diguanylate cyclase (GGDEF)-like protein
MNKKILVIDDGLFFRQQIKRILMEAGYDVITAVDGEDGLLQVKTEKPDLVLLDVVMPGVDGFEVCRILRDSESNNLMPIILLSAMDAQDDKLVGLELGADDYITKPFNERELLSRIRNTLRRIDRNRAANPLTGLSGNLEIQREISSRIAKEEQFAVIYVDLDNFKSYNDAYGYAKGDIAIKLTADILSDTIQQFGNQDDFVGHIGGDDYVLVTTPEKMVAICRETIQRFDERIREIFNAEDLEKGYISTMNRRGNVENFPIMSVSMAVVTNEYVNFQSHLQVAETASGVKKLVKAMEGSNYLVDRRRSR